VISVLLPTRGRTHLLPSSILSLLDNADRPQDVQICYAVDRDDDRTVDVTYELARSHDNVTVTDRYGYAGLHHYVNTLAKRASGEWLFLWNDDAVMLTAGWDTLIRAWPTKYILDTWSNHPPETCVFPIVPTEWVRGIGHFSLNAHNDTWWQEIGLWIKRLVRIDVDVLHNRHDLTGLNDDETYREKVQAHQTADFYTEHNDHLMKRDAAVIMRMLVNQRDRRMRGW
jgi:hypothetical protein